MAGRSAEAAPETILDLWPEAEAREHAARAGARPDDNLPFWPRILASMNDLRCRQCTLAIIPPQQVILARFGMPGREAEYDLKPRDGDRPEVFHVSCLPLGWLMIDWPMSLDAALARLR
jgi:hypothetical protein